MGSGNSRKQNNMILPPVSINRPGPPGLRARGPPPRFAMPCPPPFPMPCGPRIVQCPPQIRMLPPLPPRIIQLPPRFVTMPPRPPCLPAMRQPFCLPAAPQCVPCLPAPAPLRCLPAPVCQPAPICQPTCGYPQPIAGPCGYPQPAAGPCGYPQPAAGPCGYPQSAGYPQAYAGQPTCLPYPQQHLTAQPQPQYAYSSLPQGQYYAQPRSSYPQAIAAPGQEYLPAARPVSQLPSRQIEYVPTPVKQIDYAPPSISRRQLPYNGKVSRRSNYADDGEEIGDVRGADCSAGEDCGVLEDSSRGKFTFLTPGLDTSDANASTRLEYLPENASTASGVQYRPVSEQQDAATVTQQSAANAVGPDGTQYRIISGSPEGQGANAIGPDGTQYRIVSGAPEGQGATATGSQFGINDGQDGQGQYQGTSQASASTYRLVPQQGDGTSSGVQYRLVSSADGSAITNNGSQYRIVTQQPESASNQEATSSSGEPQYRLVQDSATPSNQYRSQQPDGSAVTQLTSVSQGGILDGNANVTSATPSQFRYIQNSSAASGVDNSYDQQQQPDGQQQEYVEAVSDDGVHYQPLPQQPVLTNVRLSKTFTQKSERALSNLQYLLNNYNSSNAGNNNTNTISSLINNLNNNNSNLGNNSSANNTFSVARSAGTLSQTQQEQQQYDGQDMIEIPVQVPVKVRIPAPNPANKQQTYNTTIECRQKPYCPERDGPAN